LVDLVGIFQSTINRNDVLNEDIDSHRMLLMLPVNRQCFLIKTVLSGNSCDISSVVVLKLVDIANNLALVSANGSEEKEVLEILVVAEWRRFDDDFFQQFDKLDGKIGLEEGLDGDGNIIGVSALRQGCSNKLQ
jgi:hypothetical protein